MQWEMVIMADMCQRASLAASPTTYRDVLFRSQLEARFAVFFHHMGWCWHYEPYRFFMGRWSYTPDFVVWHGVVRGERRLKRFLDGRMGLKNFANWDRLGPHLLEVKPAFDTSWAKKIVSGQEPYRRATDDYQIANAHQLAADGASVWFADGSVFQLPKTHHPLNDVPNFIRAADFASAAAGHREALFPLFTRVQNLDQVTLPVKIARHFKFKQQYTSVEPLTTAAPPPA